MFLCPPRPVWVRTRPRRQTRRATRMQLPATVRDMRNRAAVERGWLRTAAPAQHQALETLPAVPLVKARAAMAPAKAAVVRLEKAPALAQGAGLEPDLVAAAVREVDHSRG